MNQLNFEATTEKLVSWCPAREGYKGGYKGYIEGYMVNKIVV